MGDLCCYMSSYSTFTRQTFPRRGLVGCCRHEPRLLLQGKPSLLVSQAVANSLRDKASLRDCCSLSNTQPCIHTPTPPQQLPPSAMLIQLPCEHGLKPVNSLCQSLGLLFQCKNYFKRICCHWVMM